MTRVFCSLAPLSPYVGIGFNFGADGELAADLFDYSKPPKLSCSLHLLFVCCGLLCPLVAVVKTELLCVLAAILIYYYYSIIREEHELGRRSGGGCGRHMLC